MSITIHAELEQLTKLGEVSDPKEVPPCDPLPVADPPSASQPKCWRCNETVSGYSCPNCGAKPSIGKAIEQLRKENTPEAHMQIHRDYKHSLIIEEQHAASLVRTPVVIEAPFPIDESIFENGECECGGTFDEDDRCSDCSNGHDDCCAQECFSCFERAQDRAERMAEGDDR